MIKFSGKLVYNKNSILGMLFITAYYLVVNFIILDIFHLTDMEYKVLFGVNFVLSFGLFIDVESYNERPKLSFIDQKIDNPKQLETKVCLYYSVLCFGIWFFVYEELVIKSLFNSFSAIAVVFISLMIRKLITKNAISGSGEDQKMYLNYHFKIKRLSDFLQFFGWFIAFGVFMTGTLIIR